MANNVIKFPSKVSKKKKTFEDFENEIKVDVKTEADETAEFLWSCVLLEASEKEFNLERGSDEIRTASILVLESIRSLLYLTKGIEHPLQEISSDMFTIEL